MKTPANSLRILLSIAVGASFLTSPLGAAEGEVVLSPNKRQEALVQAKQLLGEKTVTLSGKNPFNPEGFGESAAAAGPTQGTAATTAPAGPKTGRDLLQAIATSLKPSGFFVLSGAPTLVFGQKRVKAGGFLTITFEGSEYTLEIVSIERPNFTLRLNREEFTRPIK